MNRVYLEITEGKGWTEVETDGADEVLFTFTHDNLANPTNYVSEHSYSLKLPRTAKNNAFFGHFGEADSMIVAGGYDPTHKMRYLVLDGGGLLVSTGDAVVTEVTRTQFVLSLAGSQSRIFGRLLNSGWDTERATEDSTYTLLTDWLTMRKVGAMLLDEQTNIIDYNTVLTSWLVDDPLFSFSDIRANTLLSTYNLTGHANITETMAFIASLVGFAPTSQGRYKDFDSDKWLEIGTFHMTDLPFIGSVTYRPLSSVYGFLNAAYLPVLCSIRNIYNEPTDGIIDVGDGLIEAQMKEYRSYYQQPYVYMSALWQMVQFDFAKITGYSLELDNRWFNSSNDELKRLVYMLPPLYTGEDEPLTDAVTVSSSDMLSISSSGTSTSSPAHVLSGYDTGVTISNVAQLEQGQYAAFNGRIVVNFGYSVSGTMPTTYFAQCNAIKLVVGVDSSSHYYRKYYLICPIPTDGLVTKDDYYGSSELSLFEYITLGYEVLFPEYTPFDDITTTTYLTEVVQQIGSTYISGSPDVKNIEIEYGFVNDYNSYKTWSGGSWSYLLTPPKLSIELDGDVQTFTQQRTGSVITLERLFKDINPLDILLQYTKSRHLLWVTDDTAQTVTVVRAADYYSDCLADGVTNLTENVDVSRGVALKPLSWGTRNVMFNLNDIDGDGITGYASRYGMGYGSKKIITTNALNTDTTELLPDIHTSAMYSHTILSTDDILSTKQSYKETWPLPLNVSSGESAGIFGNFYYRHDNKSWNTIESDTISRQPTVYITDDTAKEQVFMQYCWHGTDAYDINYTGTQYYAYCSVRPVFNTVSDDGLSVLFAPVREVYTSTPDTPTEYLYDHSWAKYISEVYNAQNKTLEAYINLPRPLFDKVRTNPLVIIDHMLYLLTEIRSWGEGNSVVKCTLRQITNINNLTS